MILELCHSSQSSAVRPHEVVAAGDGLCACGGSGRRSCRSALRFSAQNVVARQRETNRVAQRSQRRGGGASCGGGCSAGSLAGEIDRSRRGALGHGGGRAEADRQQVPFLGEIPLSTEIRKGGDLGEPIVTGAPGSPHANAFLAIAGNLRKAIA